MTISSRRLSFLPSLPSRPLSQKRPSRSLEDVHVDILLIILQHLNWPEDFHSLALVSRSLRRHVTPELYKTIIITPNSRKTLALLAMLDKDADLSGTVQVLVFDRIVRSIRPRFPAPDDFESARKKDLADASPGEFDERLGDPQRVRLRLHHVLPKLANLHTVCIKRWNHTLQGSLSAAECYHYWQPGGGHERTSLLQKLRITQPYQGPPAVMHGDRQPCPLDIISLLLLRCEKIQKLYIVGTFPMLRFSNPPSAFSNLTILVIGERTSSAQVWNGILRNCRSLKVLGLLNTHFRFEKLMAGCRFPCLESIEWYGYLFSSASNSATRKPVRAFADFIEKHSETLKVISLAPRSYQPRGFPYDGGVRFFNPDNELLPNLETLRLQNWTVFSADHDQWPHAESSQSREIAEELCKFVAQRPKIVDLTITDLPADLALRLTNKILVGRTMKRLLVGESLCRSQAEHVPAEAGRSGRPRTWGMPGGMVRREQKEWAVTRKQQYLRDVWLSYELSFQGLALEECGYRPWLLHVKCPRSYVDYLRR